jgi:hypothetical protein
MVSSRCKQQSPGYSRTDGKGYRSTVQIGSLRIDPHPQNGVILRRIRPDGGDVHSTRHPDESAAKRKALEEFHVALANGFGLMEQPKDRLNALGLTIFAVAPNAADDAIE